jgi:hypothetical protein
MSKIDTSERSRVFQLKTGGWAVKYKGKEYNYFASKEGAKAYLEVLKSGEKGAEGAKIPAVSRVSGVLQSISRPSSTKPRKRTYPELL